MKMYIGIDWSEQQHDVVFLNPAGGQVLHLVLAHRPSGFEQLDQARQKLGLNPSECEVALETAHNLLIDFLWSRGYDHVYVIAPSVIKSCRGRYGQSGARTDEQDGRLIADVLRTDQARLQRWFPDSLLTQQLRAKVGFINHLSRTSVRWSNRLRAVLVRYYPAALNIFSSLKTQIALAFIQAYPTPQAAAALSWSDFQAFAHQHGYRRPSQLPACFARLQQEQAQASPETALIYQQEAVWLATILGQLLQHKNATLTDLTTLFEQHPDQAIFASLPGAGQFLAPALLTKFGDDRHRFPTAASLQALAGTCPVTDQSGKRRTVKFRQACDREFRWIVQEWARHSLDQSIWAAMYWQQVRPHCHSDSHAYRCLGNRWLAIAWKLWQTGQAYDETYHLRQRALRAQPRA